MQNIVVLYYDGWLVMVTLWCVSAICDIKKKKKKSGTAMKNNFKKKKIVLNALFFITLFECQRQTIQQS